MTGLPAPAFEMIANDPAGYTEERLRAFPPNFLHESWRDFLYWDTELDP